MIILNKKRINEKLISAYWIANNCLLLHLAGGHLINIYGSPEELVDWVDQLDNITVEKPFPKRGELPPEH